MTPIIEEKDVILTKNITNKHLIVAVIHNLPCILGSDYFTKEKIFRFYLLNDPNSIITDGNAFELHPSDSIQATVEKALSLNYKVAVFKPKDWRKAMEWLLKNVE